MRNDVIRLHHYDIENAVLENAIEPFFRNCVFHFVRMNVHNIIIRTGNQCSNQDLDNHSLRVFAAIPHHLIKDLKREFINSNPDLLNEARARIAATDMQFNASVLQIITDTKGDDKQSQNMRSFYMESTGISLDELVAMMQSDPRGTMRDMWLRYLRLRMQKPNITFVHNTYVDPDAHIQAVSDVIGSATQYLALCNRALAPTGAPAQSAFRHEVARQLQYIQQMFSTQRMFAHTRIS